MDCVICLFFVLVSSNVNRIRLVLGDNFNQAGVCPQNQRVIRYRIVKQKSPSAALPLCSIGLHDVLQTESKKCRRATSEVKEVTRLEKYTTNITIFTCCPTFKPIGNICVPEAMSENDTIIGLNQKTEPEKGIDMDVFLMAFSIVAAGIVTVILIIILSVQCRWVSCLKIRRLKESGIVRVTRRGKNRNSRQQFAFLDLAQSATSSRCSCIAMTDHTDFDNDDTSNSTSLNRRSLPSVYEIQGFHVQQENHTNPYPMLDPPLLRPRPTGRAELQEPSKNHFDCDDYAVVLSFGNSFKHNHSTEEDATASANDYITTLRSKFGDFKSNSRHGHVFSTDMSVTNDYVTGVGTRLDDMTVGYVTTIGAHPDCSESKNDKCRLFPSQFFAASELDSVAEYITSVKKTHDNIRSMVNRESTSTYDSNYMTPMDATRTLSSNATSADYDDVDLLHNNFISEEY